MNAQIRAVTSTSSHPYDLLAHTPNLDAAAIEKRITDWCYAVAEEQDLWQKSSPEANQIPKYIDQLMGKQWDTGRPKYKSAPVNNLLLRSMEQTIAVLTDIRLAYTVGTQNQTLKQQAEKLTKMSKAWWVNQDVDLDFAMALTHAYLSTGFIRYFWNPRLFGGKGDFQCAAEGINSVLPIGPATHRLQDWEGLTYTCYKPMGWFKRNFKEKYYKVVPNLKMSSYAVPVGTPNYMTTGAFHAAGPAMRRFMGGTNQVENRQSAIPIARFTQFWVQDDSVNVSDQPVFVGKEKTNWSYWVHPGQPLYPRGRLIVTGGENFAVLDDGPNYLWHGRYPFIDLRVKQVPWQYHGVSELRSKVPLQKVVNEVMAGILDMVKKAINPTLLYQSEQFSSNFMKNADMGQPGLKLGYGGMSNQVPTWSQPPSLPSYVPQLAEYAQQQIQDDSGLLGVADLGRKKITPAGDTLAELKEPQQTIMRLRGRYMEHAVSELGEQMVSNFIQFYSIERRIMMFGVEDGTVEQDFDYNPDTMIPSGMKPQEFIQQFKFQISPDTLLNSSRDQRAMLYMALRRQGDMSRKTLYDGLDMGAMIEKVEKQLQIEKEQSLREAVITTLIQAVPALASLFATGDINVAAAMTPPQPNTPPSPIDQQAGNPGGTGKPFPGGKGSVNPQNLITPEP